jgi:hypothetical protein
MVLPLNAVFPSLPCLVSEGNKGGEEKERASQFIDEKSDGAPYKDS